METGVCDDLNDAEVADHPTTYSPKRLNQTPNPSKARQHYPEKKRYAVCTLIMYQSEEHGLSLFLFRREPFQKPALE